MKLMENRMTNSFLIKKIFTWFFFMLTAAILSINLAYWIPAKEIDFGSHVISNDLRFTGGPYPDASTLAKLKKQGYTTIISLLDPWALPQEVFLIDREETNAARLGLSLIHIPMLTGKTDSIETSRRMDEVAKSFANQKYYVHGYGESERVSLFINHVNQAHSASAAATAVAGNSLTSMKTVLHLERGAAIQLDHHVIVSPKPTLEELKKYFINTSIRTVISLNPDEDAAESAEMIALLKAHHIAWYNLPIRIYPYDPQAVLKIVDQVKSLPDGVLVYSLYMPPQSTAISAFMISWFSHLPALPKNIFRGIPMHEGEVKIIAPNVAIGPQPNEAEFRDYLAERSIKKLGYAGPCETAEANHDAQLAQAAGMNWICLQSNDSIMINKLRTEGPWYVYGPSLALIESELIKRLYKWRPDQTLQG